MIRRMLRSQNGFSMIQGMLLAGAVAAMAYVGTKLTTDQKLAQKGVEAKGKVEQLHSMIYSIMQNKDHCSTTFNKYGIIPALNSTATLSHIETKDSTVPVFSQNTQLGGGTYNPALVYMGNSVTINEMKVTFPASWDQHANLRIVYGKLNSTDVAARTGKGYGSQQVAKTIKLKIQRDPSTNNFESCYAVDEAENQNMVKDFCEGLGADNDPFTANLFEWSDTYQRCVLKDIHCPSGQVFTGYDSNGLRKCFAIKDWMDVGELIDQNSVTACNATASNAVSFVVVGNQVKVQCAPGGGCTDSCQCPGSMWMVCESGVCVNRMSSTCVNGTFAKGDSSCRFMCTGGFWSCPAAGVGPPICGGSAVNCAGSWSTCASSSQTYTITTPASGGGTACAYADGQTRACVSCTPVNGGWSAWGPYGSCSGGVKTRYRTCNNPATSCGGTPCAGGSSSTSTTGCGGCFVAGTEVEMADGSTKNIEDILLGDQLRDSESKIVNVKKLMVSDYWGEVHSINGGPYFFTPNHPFLTLDGWKSLAPEASRKESPGLKVSQMKTGDILVKKTGLELILTIDAKVTEEKIYNFQLDGSHSYLADEYKVHNKCMPMACSSGFYFATCDPTNCTGSCIPNGDPAPHCM